MLCYFLLLAVDSFPMNTVLYCVSVLVSFEIYITWNRKFYLGFTGSRVAWFLLVWKKPIWIWTSNSCCLHHFFVFFANNYQVCTKFPIFQFQWTIKIFQSITRRWWFLNFLTGQTKSPGYSPERTWLGHRDMAQLHYLIIYSIHFLRLFLIIFQKKVLNFSRTWFV